MSKYKPRCRCTASLLPDGTCPYACPPKAFVGTGPNSCGVPAPTERLLSVEEARRAERRVLPGRALVWNCRPPRRAATRH